MSPDPGASVSGSAMGATPVPDDAPAVSRFASRSAARSSRSLDAYAGATDRGAAQRKIASTALRTARMLDGGRRGSALLAAC